MRYVRTLVTQLTYWPLLWRELRRADVVHVFSASYTSFLLAPLPAWLVARALGKPVLLNYHSGEAADHLRRSRLARTVLRRIGTTIVPSRFLVEVFAQIRPRRRGDPQRDRSRALPLPAPRAAAAAPALDAQLRGELQRRLHAARLRPRPGPPSRRDAHRRRIGIRGGRRCTSLAAALGLRGVTFAGRVAPAEIARHYADADVYVQTPAVDNMPLSVLEAFASGVPVVSTDVGGVRAMLTDGVHGLLAPPDDDAAIADRVCRLLEEPGSRQPARRGGAPRDRRLRVGRGARPVGRGLRPAGAAVDVAGRRARTFVMRAARLLRRVAAMPAAEIRDRLASTMRREAARLAHRARPAAWRRDELAGRARAADGGARRRDRAPVGGTHRRRAPRPRPSLRRAAAAMADRADDARRRRAARSALAFPMPRRTRSGGPTPSPTAASTCSAIATSASASTTPESSGRHPRRLRSRRRRRSPAIDWHRDPVHGRVAPALFWSEVPYLDPACGDHKIIWELNRHQHFLALGRAWWLAGHRPARATFVRHLASWMDANPPLVGINWASMLELALRSLSWIWALEFFVEPAAGGDRPDRQPIGRAPVARRSAARHRSPAAARRAEPVDLLQPQHPSARRSPRASTSPDARCPSCAGRRRGPRPDAAS